METRAKIGKILNDKRAVGLIAAIICLAVIWFTESSAIWGTDLLNYYNITEAILDGKMPYRDAMFEYPPFALVFMLIPRMLSWNLNSFHFAFAAQTYVFLIIGFHFLYKIADEFIGKRWQSSLIFLCLLACGTYLVIARNDVYPAVLSLIGMWLYLKNRTVASFAFIAVAAMTKLYPAIFMIPMIIPLLLGKKWRILAQSIAVAVAIVFLIELPFLVADSTSAFAYLSYHSDRGLQIESVASSFFLVANLLFPGCVGVEFGYGSDNLTGAGPDALAPWMNMIMAIAIVMFMVIMIYRILKSPVARKNCVPLATLLCVATLMIFVTFSKVYSAQYYIWIMLALPFALLSDLKCCQKKQIMPVVILFSICTLMSYTAYGTLGLLELNPAPVLLTVLKNIIHLVLLIIIIHMCWEETKST